MTYPAGIPKATIANSTRLSSRSFIQARHSPRQGKKGGGRGDGFPLAPFIRDPSRDPGSGCFIRLSSSEPRSRGRCLAIGVA